MLGFSVAESQVPYFVHLVAKYPGGSFVCGGSLVSPRLVLTAAHCTEGSSHIDVKHPTSGRTVVSYDFQEHPAYTHERFAHDLSLVRLPQSISIERYATLRTEPAAAGEHVSCVGYGLNEEGLLMYPRLLGVNLNVVSAEDCRKWWNSEVIAGDICAKGACVEGRCADSCGGDSGGPLFEASSPDTVIGVVSRGSEPCGSEEPGIYASFSDEQSVSWLLREGARFSGARVHAGGSPTLSVAPPTPSAPGTPDAPSEAHEAPPPNISSAEPPPVETYHTAPPSFPSFPASSPSPPEIVDASVAPSVAAPTWVTRSGGVSWSANARHSVWEFRERNAFESCNFARADEVIPARWGPAVHTLPAGFYGSNVGCEDGVPTACECQQGYRFAISAGPTPGLLLTLALSWLLAAATIR